MVVEALEPGVEGTDRCRPEEDMVGVASCEALRVVAVVAVVSGAATSTFVARDTEAVVD